MLERRVEGGLRRFPFDGAHDGAFFAGHEGAGPEADVQVEMEPRLAEDVLAQKPLAPRLKQGVLEAPHRVFVFLAHVDDPVAGAHGDGGQDHAFDHLVRAFLDEGPVHEGARVPFVAVGHDELDGILVLVGCFEVALGQARPVPFAPGGKARPAAPAQLRLGDLDDDVARLPGRIAAFAQDAVDGFVAALGEIGLDLVRVGLGGELEHQAVLQLHEVGALAVGPGARPGGDALFLLRERLVGGAAQAHQAAHPVGRLDRDDIGAVGAEPHGAFEALDPDRALIHQGLGLDGAAQLLAQKGGRISRRRPRSGERYRG